MEQQRQALETEIYKMELTKPLSSVTEKDLERVFKKIRDKLQSGDLVNIRHIIEVYVERIEVFPDHVVIQFNYLPKVMLPVYKGREAELRAVINKALKCLPFLPIKIWVILAEKAHYQNHL